MATSPSPTPPSTTECHILPCSIDYTGKAPVSVYFQPTPFQEGLYQAAQFRGRGLLALEPVAVSGRLLNVKDNKVTTQASFDRITEWQHVHQTAALTSSGRVQRALDWNEIASALHSKLPVETEN
jgi:hypothetical protein